MIDTDSVVKDLMHIGLGWDEGQTPTELTRRIGEALGLIHTLVLERNTALEKVGRLSALVETSFIEGYDTGFHDTGEYGAQGREEWFLSDAVAALSSEEE